jgi:hypothetical protein
MLLSVLFIRQAVQYFLPSDSAACLCASPVIFTASWWTAARHSNNIINKASKNTQEISKTAEVAVCMVW